MQRISILSMLCLSLAAAEQPSNKTLFRDGLVEGFLSDRPDVKNCVGDSQIVLGDISQGLKDLVAGKSEEGFKKLSDALAELPTEIRNCNATEADLKNIIMVLEEFKGLQKFSQHVIQDLVDNFRKPFSWEHPLGEIMMELQRSYYALGAQMYLESGRELGMALHRIVIGEQTPGPSGPTPPVPQPAAAAMCKNNPACADLGTVDGLCCPTGHGTILDCCNQAPSMV